ncbi:MAG: gliding motility-associated protein GldE [Bacteroidota bacterium]
MDLSDPLPVAFSLILMGLAYWQLALGLLGIALLLVLSGLVSGSEVAFFSLDANDDDEVDNLDTVPAKLLLQLREKPRRLLATILIANNFINIAIVLLSEWLLRGLFPAAVFNAWASGLLERLPVLSFISETGLATGIRILITVIGVTFLLVLFGEVAPKVYARFNKVRLALFMARPLSFLMNVFSPLSFTLVSGAAVIERRLENHSQDAAAASQQEIDEAIDLTVSTDEYGEEGGLQDVSILKRIVQFANVTVRQVMRSRGDVIAVEQGVNYHELLAVVREHGYSRIPVFAEDFDQVKGLLYVKDLLGHRHEAEDFDWRALVREEVLYVPENKKISDLLKEFQQEKMHLAIVVDEYGGTEGIVTLEDILEEVIGDIQDEFDEDNEIIYEQIDEQNYVFDGKTLLNDVCRVLDLSTNTFDGVKGEAESFAGLLLEMLGQFPEEDQEIECGEYRFKVMSLTKRRVAEILITLPAEE